MRSLQRLIPLLLGACLVQAPAVAVDFAFEPAIAQGEVSGETKRKTMPPLLRARRPGCHCWISSAPETAWWPSAPVA